MHCLCVATAISCAISGLSCSRRESPELQAIDISAGVDRTCAVSTTGKAFCWNIGDTSGDGASSDKVFIAKPVDGLDSDVVSIAVGESHACALLSTWGSRWRGHSVMCWGSNKYGQIGDGSYIDRSEPTQVLGLQSGVAAITAGDVHSCAATTDADVLCWGGNDFNQIDVIPQNTPAPTLVPRPENGATSVSASRSFTCALSPIGKAYCWGSTMADFYPGGSANSQDFAARRFTPTLVPDFDNSIVANSLSSGQYHGCALDSAGTAKCWGSSNSFKQVGDAAPFSAYNRSEVVKLADNVAAVKAGGDSTCVLTVDGEVKCRGFLVYGPKPRDEDARSLKSIPELGTNNASLAIGKSHICTIKSDRSVVCCAASLNDGVKMSCANVIVVQTGKDCPSCATTAESKLADAESQSDARPTGDIAEAFGAAAKRKCLSDRFGPSREGDAPVYCSRECEAFSAFLTHPKLVGLEGLKTLLGFLVNTSASSEMGMIARYAITTLEAEDHETDTE